MFGSPLVWCGGVAPVLCQVIVGGMLAGNISLAVLDLSRNHLGQSSALSIAGGLKSNRGLRTLKLGWNALGRYAVRDFIPFPLLSAGTAHKIRPRFSMKPLVGWQQDCLISFEALCQHQSGGNVTSACPLNIAKLL